MHLNCDVPFVSCLTSLTCLTFCTTSGDPYKIQEALHSVQKLPALLTLCLHNYSSLPANLAWPEHLQTLVLYGGHDKVCNLAHCTQLTQLAVTLGPSMDELRLPGCATACLKHLDITVCEVMGLDQVGLGVLTQLTHLGLRSTKLGQVTKTGWPKSLPCLKSLCCESIARLPLAIFQYTGLTHLDISFWQGRTLPEGIGNLQQLLTLDLPCSSLDTFPMFVLRLTQLSRLNMGNADVLEFPEDIIQMANWPNLTKLDFTFRRRSPSTGYRMDSCLNFFLLHEALGPRKDIFEVTTSFARPAMTPVR